VSVLNVHLFGPDDGRPVVALHGVTGHAHRWGVLAEQLPELRLVAVDLRGHGRSPKTPPWGFEQHVADVLAVMDDHGLERAPLIGHSFGGAIALHLAKAAPDRVEKLVLVDPALGLDPVARRSLLESMVYVTRRADRTILFSSHLLSDVERVADYVGVLDRSVLRAQCPLEAFRGRVKQFVLHFPSKPPALPPIRGLLHARRSVNELRVTVANPDAETDRILRSLGATSVDEVPFGFEEALIGYLGDRGTGGFFLDVAAAESAAPVTTERGAA